MLGCFVTGTDTGVGKTVVSVSLLRALARAGRPAVGMKPVAAGCEATAGGLRNADALALQGAAGRWLPYPRVNPVALEPPMAPHLAAERMGLTLRAAPLARQAHALPVAGEYLVVEGAGGWRVPLNDTETMADLAVAIGLPVVLVVAIRLGCLNHALLSAGAIAADGLPLAGWVAVELEPDGDAVAEQIATLEHRLGAPRLGTISWRGLSFDGDASTDLCVAWLTAGEAGAGREPGPA